MKCPNCGTEIPAGSLYCEKCGEDIHIVPDFEPEVEYNLEQTLNDIAGEFRGQDEQKDNNVEVIVEDKDEEQSDDPKDAQRSIKKMIAWIIAFLVILLAGAIVGIQFYRYNSVDVQLELAGRSLTNGQYERAVEYYKRALELDEDNVDIKIALSDVYFQKNNKIEYEYWLWEIVKDPTATPVQLESAYGKLIAIYRARGDYKTIYELLQDSGNEDIIARYQSYVPEPPEFSLEEGYYSTVQPLKLTAPGVGEIYYTLDGSIPDENSNLYTIPILLEDGDYFVSAYFVNENGIASEVVTRNYYITVETLPPPEVGLVSGDYTTPTRIEILEDTDNIYYTTDGSTPTELSRLYTEPIPMPLGRSTFKFARIAEDKSSEVVERNFNLVLNTENTIQDVEWVVIQYAVSSGKISDYEGHFTDTEEMYKYEYQYVTNINGVDDFFVIAEFYSDAGGVKNRTGNYYAVNVYTKELFKLQIDGRRYTLIEIEKESE